MKLRICDFSDGDVVILFGWKKNRIETACCSHCWDYFHPDSLHCHEREAETQKRSSDFLSTMQWIVSDEMLGWGLFSISSERLPPWQTVNGRDRERYSDTEMLPFLPCAQLEKKKKNYTCIYIIVCVCTFSFSTEHKRETAASQFWVYIHI